MFSCEFAKRGPVNFSANMEQNPGVKYEDKKKIETGKKAGINIMGRSKRLEFKMER